MTGQIFDICYNYISYEAVINHNLSKKYGIV